MAILPRTLAVVVAAASLTSCEHLHRLSRAQPVLGSPGAGPADTSGVATSGTDPSGSAPIVNSVTGSFNHKAAVTISGSSFGTKAQAAPVIWDDASAASIYDHWDGAWPDNNPTYETSYRLPQRGISLPHNHITRYIAGG